MITNRVQWLWEPGKLFRLKYSTLGDYLAIQSSILSTKLSWVPLSQLSDSPSLKMGVRQMEYRDEMHSLVQWGPHSASLTYYLPGPKPLL